MDKKILERHIENGLSLRQIGNAEGKSLSAIRHWVKKFDLKTKHLQFSRREAVERGCITCGETDPEKFYGHSRSMCKNCHAKDSFRRQRANRTRGIEYLGGECKNCGFKGCDASFDFHHRVPAEKADNFIRHKTWSWEHLKSELDKCDLLCANCHREHHFLND